MLKIGSATSCYSVRVRFKSLIRPTKAIPESKPATKTAHIVGMMEVVVRGHSDPGKWGKWERVATVSFCGLPCCQEDPEHGGGHSNREEDRDQPYRSTERRDQTYRIFNRMGVHGGRTDYNMKGMVFFVDGSI